MDKRILIIIAVLGGLAAGSALSAESVDGYPLYRSNCVVCHGENGGGGVGVPLNLPDFLAVASDDYLRSTIRNGRPGRVMPAFPRLNDTEINAIIAYIRGLSKEPAPVYSSAGLHGDAARGKTLFDSHCTACHGELGQGGTGTGVTFSRPRGAPVMAPALDNRGFQAAVSDAMLKATLLRGRRGTPMPSISSLGLAESDADDLVAYLRTLHEQVQDEAPEAPVIQYESSYDLETTLTNLKQSVVGHNFRVIREQLLEQGLAEPGKEDQRAVILYFCDFGFLNKALAIDPRVGLFLPCRITLLETEHGVKVMSINPKNLSHLFNNSELDKACQKMHDLYAEIMEEATL
jgi:cbb3-type cytochrome c oxidase subunit III